MNFVRKTVKDAAIGVGILDTGNDSHRFKASSEVRKETPTLATT